MTDPEPKLSPPGATPDGTPNPGSDPQPATSAETKRPGIFSTLPIFGDRPSNQRKSSVAVAPESPLAEPTSQQSQPGPTRDKGSKPPSLLPEAQFESSDFGLQVFKAEEPTPVSVDIIAVHDLGETASDAWTDGVGPATGRVRGTMAEREREASPSSHDQRPPPVKRLTGDTLADPKGKNDLLAPTVPLVNDRQRSTERSARSSSEFDKRRVNWLQDLLSHDIPQSRILAFSYPEPNFGKKSGGWIRYVENVAQQLLNYVGRYRSDAGNRNVPIVFIGYGFGGVIIQKAIELAVTRRQSQDESVLVPAQAIYQMLFLDTPFPEPEHEDGAEERLFPPNTNVRMCDIIRQIEEREKDSEILETLWASFLNAYEKAYASPDDDIDVTWLYSQAKTKPAGEHLQLSSLVADRLNVTSKIDITMTSVSTFRHRRLAIIPDAQDYIYRAILSRMRSTLLFQGIYLRNSDLIFSILESKNLAIIRDLEGDLTPLHAAAKLRPPDEPIVTKLINQMPDDIMQRDEKGRIPLHFAIDAAWKTWTENSLSDGIRSDFKEIISFLMRNMQRTDFDIKDDYGISPWDVLTCNPGNCRCGQENPMECPAYWIWELRDNLEPISGPALEEDTGGLTEPVAPGEESAQYRACVTTNGTVAEFYHVFDEKTKRTQERINLKTPSVYRMIYDPRYGCAKILEFSRRYEESQNFRCRWIHIPANNEQWLSDLILSLGVQDDSMDDERHDGLSIFNRYMNPHAKKYDFKQNKTQDDAPILTSRASLPSVPEEQFEAETTHSTRRSTQTSSIDAEASRHASSSSMRTSWESLCLKHPISGLAGKLKTVALFMPVLSYESHEEWKLVFGTITAHATREKTPDSLYRRGNSGWIGNNSPGSVRSHKDTESDLIDGYISPSDDTGPLHCRRTLDQYSYYMLETTERRDKDQVVYRWAAEKQRKASQPGASTSWEPSQQGDSTLSSENLFSDPALLNSSPIVMIDQLWLWVMPNGTVITSLPNTHRQSEKYNIRTLLSREIEKNKKRSAIRGPEDLVGIVLETCLEVMTREGPSRVKLQECFQSSINAIAEDEAVAMEKFLSSVDNLAKAKDPFLLTEEIDSFSKISTESKRLVEIIDIRDELDIIKSVLTTQKKVLKQLRDTIRSEGRSSTSENPDGKYSPESKSDVKSNKAYGDTAFRNTVAVEDALWIVDDNLTRVKEMDDSATRVHDSLKQLLDFKQQQASGWESRYAKKLSEQGQRQNTVSCPTPK
ncbi:hypothetical protein B0T16DRAFT_188724 [Cercophora newfieldiana]|uniref:Ankyrin repeat protein n=1 Tax=Cercophora newfieldiana TaxID=92897 RepID=A0AA40CND1_9PEZI|nr:hypothetical protein B0T16DRAFT_188724 [Cercophora newfieldiana]